MEYCAVDVRSITTRAISGLYCAMRMDWIGAASPAILDCLTDNRVALKAKTKRSGLFIRCARYFSGPVPSMWTVLCWPSCVKPTFAITEAGDVPCSARFKTAESGFPAAEGIAGGGRASRG